MSEHEWRDAPDVGQMLESARGRVSDRQLRLFGAGCVRLAWRSLVDDRSRSAVEVAERLADGAAGEAERAAAEREALAAAEAVRDGPSPWRDAVAAVRDAVLLISQHPRTIFYDKFFTLQNFTDLPAAAERTRSASAPFPDLRKGVGPAVKATARAERFRQEYDGAGERAPDYFDSELYYAASEYASAQDDAIAAWRAAGRGAATLDAAVQAAARAAAACCAAEGFADCWRLLPPKGQMRLLRCLLGNPFKPVTLDPGWRTSDAVALARGIYADRAFDRLPILADALQDAGCEDAAVLDHCRGPGPHARGCWVVDLVFGKQEAQSPNHPLQQTPAAFLDSDALLCAPPGLLSGVVRPLHSFRMRPSWVSE